MTESMIVVEHRPVELPEPSAMVAIEAAESPGLPDPGAVFQEQLRTVGESLHREALGLAGILALVTVTILSQLTTSHSSDVDLVPQALIPIALLGLLAPLAVWKSEGPGRRGYHRSMPVDAAEHAIDKAAAGFVWTMAAAAGYVVWLLGIMLLSGGELVDDSLTRWAGPFVGGTVLYLLGSAVALVARHPWRWLAGGVVGYTIVNVMAGGIPAVRPLQMLIEMFWSGPFGLLTVITGLTGGVPHFEWSVSPGTWLAASAGWLAGSAALFLAAARHQPDE